MPEGRFIVIVGPDGTGKSALADSLVRILAHDHPVRRFHHRLRVLPASAASMQATTEPHAQSPYPAWASYLKILYLFADELLGWLIRVWAFRRRGGWVVVERGWWDVVVDPRRYRIGRGARLAARLGRFLPAPDATLILSAPPAIIERRKTELAPAELERQLRAWQTLAPRMRRAALLDASAALDAVVRAAVDAVGLGSRAESELAGTLRRVAFPPWGRTRWLIPPGRRVAPAGIRIYQPMTLARRVGWEAARVVAATGAFHLLPPGEASGVTWAVERFVPRGGSVAVTYARDPRRAVAVVLDARGHAICAVKVALETEGRGKLAREAERIAVLGSLLRPPLSAPRVLEADAGIIVLEAVDWLPRRRPWLLPAELAEGIGRFYAINVEHDGFAGNPAHGDFAPWNVMRTHAGWVLLDWEEATAPSPPYADPFHYLVQGHALLGRPHADEILDGVRGTGWIARSLRHYADAAGLPDIDVREALAGYLRDSAAMQDPSRADGRRGLEARRRLLGALGIGRDGGSPRA